MKDPKKLAKLLLIQIQSLKEIDTADALAVDRQLTLITEIVEDAEQLATIQLEEKAA